MENQTLSLPSILLLQDITKETENTVWLPDTFSNVP